MRIIALLLASSVATLSMPATAASFSPIGLFNTGVSVWGTPRPNYSDELHYTLISAPAGAPMPILRTARSINGYPFPAWTADNSFSSWIGPRNSGLYGASGSFVYRTTFSLAGLNPATASITGRWAADNAATNILLNGVGTGQTGGTFTGWGNFNLNSGFVAGLNTLDFAVTNGSGSTGLRVEMTGRAANAVPEPASWALMIAGFGLTGSAMRRRRFAVVAA